MGHPTILFGSVTWAMRAQKLLEQRGFRSNIRKIAHSKKLGGCGYGLELQGDLSAALSILRKADIRIIDVYTGGTI